MKGIMYDLKMYKAVLKKLHLGRKYTMIKFREDWSMPEIRFPNQVLLKSKLTGICASDLNQIHVNLPYSASILAKRENPFPMGHEVIGEVIGVGSNVEGLQIGDRVAHSPVAPCESYGFELCPSCIQGRPETCHTIVGIGDGSELEEEYGTSFGGFSGGGFCEYFTSYQQQLAKVPEGLPDEVAVLAEPFAVSLHSVLRAFPKDDETVVVIGSGIIGLMIITTIRALGSKSRIISLGRYPFQAAAAKQLGVDEVIMERNTEQLYERIAELTNGCLVKPALGKKILYGNSGPDIIYDSVGSDRSLDDALHLVKCNGKIVVVGMDFGVTKKTNWILHLYKELDVIGSMMHGIEEVEGRQVETLELALELLSSNPQIFENLVTHTFRIDDYKSAFNIASQKGKHQAIKVVFDFT